MPLVFTTKHKSSEISFSSVCTYTFGVARYTLFRLMYHTVQHRHHARFEMPRSKELSEKLRRKIIIAHKSEEGYKKITQQFDVNVSTVRQIVYKWRYFKTTTTLLQSGRPRKISSRTARQLVVEVSKNPRVTSRELQSSLARDDIHVHRSTIQRTPNQVGLHDWVARKKPLLKTKHCEARLKFAKTHLDKTFNHWKKDLWTDEMKIELF